jgi:heterodisulfide reductase subunit B2
MNYTYFPGCSLEKNAACYDASTRAIASRLGMQLREVEDWNCCGATEYVSLNLTAAYSLIARNLAQASKDTETRELVAPCSACYLNLRKCDKVLGQDPPFAARVSQALAAGGLAYKPGSLHIRHLLDVLYQDVGVEAIAAKATKPLKGLRVAPYYGCMIVRPEFHNGGDDPEFPTSLDEILKALGADVIDYPLKATCCGGHMTQISEATGFDMIHRLVKSASDLGADLIATLCPMCQLNLDGFQGAANRHFGSHYHMPVLYFTQLIGLAMGMSEREMGIGEEIVDSRAALSRIGSEMAAEAAEPKRPRKDDKSLPMPPPLKRKQESMR